VLAEDAVESAQSSGFTVSLASFEGPFDLLLHLISKHKLEVTELALHQVTDDFISHIRSQGSDWNLDETTEFLVVAATLLDLKAARLLPSGEVEDEEDLALLEARDLLFARLLQYKAFKDVAKILEAQFELNVGRFERKARLEEPYASLLPELVVAISPVGLAELAEKVFAPKPQPEQVSTTHLHAPVVNVREQGIVIAQRLKTRGRLTFRALVADADSSAVVIARFLALLELFRERVVAFDQPQALGELVVRWIGHHEEIHTEAWDDFDDNEREEGSDE
jgi:segregation and condensation protein A